MGKVVVDTDFLNHILNTPNGKNVMQKIIDFYGFELVMHPWVYDREIKGIRTDIDTYVQENVKVLKYSDFLSQEDEQLYDITFKDLYSAMNRGEPVDENYKTFKTYNRSQKNLGEIHSVILASFSGIPLLLSDDYNAKEIAAKRINSSTFQLDVKKSFDILCEMVTTDTSLLSLQEDVIPIIREHKQAYQKQYIQEIKKLYN